MGRKRRLPQGSSFAAENEALRNPPRFGGFYDKDGYNGKPPSRAVLLTALYVAWNQRREYYRRSAKLVDGEIFSVDETHKVMKGIRVDDQDMFNGIFTVMNEHNQVVAQVSILVSQGPETVCK